MSQNPYENPEAARTYDEENTGRQDFDFCLELARELSLDGPGISVLDIGAGTGALGVELAGSRN
ncbi:MULTISPECIES: hypothetical protein [unclassified Brachybacterium]|uniref:hypothetical protein n=1 Tax=unclassified Brachybacterium TaxID=2623841 RepID=UPI003F8F97FF